MESLLKKQLRVKIFCCQRFKEQNVGSRSFLTSSEPAHSARNYFVIRSAVKRVGGQQLKQKKLKKASGDFLFCLPNLFECPQRINNKILYRKKKKRTQVCKSWCVLPRKKCLQKEEERSNSTTLRRLLYLGRVWKWALQFVTVRTKEERVNDGERESEQK